MWEVIIILSLLLFVAGSFKYIARLKGKIKRYRKATNKIEGGTELFFKQVDGITKIQ
jgi:hypothetical protein